mgnify:CR=1 FL=1
MLSISKHLLISFREWLHSYHEQLPQHVPEILKEFSSLSESGFIPTSWDGTFCLKGTDVVLISFREWLHSYEVVEPSRFPGRLIVLISFRE